MVVVALKISQQVVEPLALGHKHRRAQQRANVELWRALQLEQVFGHQNANDVFTLALKHRKTRVRGVNHAVQHGIKRVSNVDQLHAGAGHHHVAGAHIGHANHTFEHFARFGTYELVVLSLYQGVEQFIGGVGAGVNELSNFL